MDTDIKCYNLNEIIHHQNRNTSKKIQNQTSFNLCGSILRYHGVVPTRLLLVKISRSMFLFENCRNSKYSSHIEQNALIFKHFSLVENPLRNTTQILTLKYQSILLQNIDFRLN